MIAQFRAHMSHGPLVASGPHPISKMCRVEIPGDIHKAVNEKYPRDGEVVVASPTPVADGTGLIPREAPVREPEGGRIAAIARVAPVQLREIEKDVDAAPEQVGAGDDVDPVTEADVVRVSDARRVSGGPR